jgi:uncharacterized OsmC-like protein
MTTKRYAAKLRSKRMSLTATARSIPGTLRQEVVIDGKHRLITDEPKRLGGDGSGPAPHELFPAALASCVSTTLVMYARTKGWELGGVSVTVDYDNHSTPRRFEVAIELVGSQRSSCGGWRRPRRRARCGTRSNPASNSPRRSAAVPLRPHDRC